MASLKDTGLPQELIRSRTDPERYLEDFEEPHSSREFLSIKNLDNYFNNIYEYHKQGGFWSIIYSKISNLVTIAFTISFSVFLIGFINWKQVINCGNSADECKNIVLIQNNISKHKTFGTLVIIYTIVFALYLVWHLLNFIVSLSSLKTTQLFFSDKLKINDSILRQIEWSHVINQIVSLQKKSIRLYHNKFLDALDITNRILRKENYIIAFINKGILDFRLPIMANPYPTIDIRKRIRAKTVKLHKRRRRSFRTKFKTENMIATTNEEQNTLLSQRNIDNALLSAPVLIDDSATEMTEWQYSKGYLGSVLEWNIRYIIFSAMFDDEMKIKQINPKALKRKFVKFGIGNLVLTPFTLVFRIIFFFLQNAEEMHNNKTDLFSFREWTTVAKLRFREINELSHTFEKRMLFTHDSATKYINSFPNKPHIRILGELLSYISGSIVAVLLLLTFIDSSILLNIQLFNRSLVWFLAIFTALLAISRSAMHNGFSYLNIKNKSDFERLMNEVSANTHYFPNEWQNKCHLLKVRNQFMQLYQPKLYIFIHEMLSVFTTPFILMFTLPNCVDKLLLFIAKHTDHIDGVGHVCSYSRFAFDNIKQYSQLRKEENKIGVLAPMDSRQISDLSNISSNTSSVDIEDSNPHSNNEMKENIALLGNKKLESSFLSFAMNNPKWRSNAFQSIVLQGIIENATVHSGNVPNMNDTSTPSSMSKTNKQLGATFSELLQTSQSQYLGHFVNENSENMQSTLFNTLQRQNLGHSMRENNQNNLMLSEINESDMSPSDSSIQRMQNDNENENEEEAQQEQQFHDAPYKTLLDHQQQK